MSKPDGEPVEGWLKPWETARFGVFLPDGSFEELPASDPVGEKHQCGHTARWVGGQSDLQLLRAALRAAPPAESERIAALEAALGKIDAIRNSIIGAQKVNWSEHIYPLVAALESVGYHGQEYEVARKNVGTMMERIAALEAALEHARLAFSALMANHDEDIGMDEHHDDDSVGWYGDGTPMLMTFGELRRARAALRAIEEVRRG